MRLRHYVINLERRPERLWAWLGAQDRMGFPVNDVTVFYGVDAHAFQTIGEVIQHAKEHGLVDLPDKHHLQSSPIDFGILGLRLSHEFLLRKIMGLNSDRWRIIWLDDVVLTRPYEHFKAAICNAPSDAKAITVNNQLQTISGKALEKHPQFPFYHGTVGHTANHCMAVLPEGAKKIVEIGKSGLSSYEYVLQQFYLGACADHLDMSGIYTPEEKWVEHSFVDKIMSDIWGTRRSAGLKTMGINMRLWRI